MAFVVAKWWGILPHVLWRYPFRYYKELRNHVIEEAQRLNEKRDEGDADFDWEEESKTGPPV